MEETKMVVLAVIIAIVAAAAIFTGIDVFLALKTAKAAPGRAQPKRTRGLSRKRSYAECIYWRKENFINWHSKKNYMTKEPKLPHKLKWGDRTAARVDGVEYLIGIRVVGYTSLKDVIIVEVHESVADEVGAWSIPEDSKYRGLGGCDVFMKKPRAGAYYKYIELKNIVHEES